MYAVLERVNQSSLSVNLAGDRRKYYREKNFEVYRTILSKVIVWSDLEWSEAYLSQRNMDFVPKEREFLDAAKDIYLRLLKKMIYYQLFAFVETTVNACKGLNVSQSRYSNSFTFVYNFKCGSYFLAEFRFMVFWLH